MKDNALDSLDLRLIDALQHRPRASWTSLAQELGSSAVTLSRRWEALVDSGVAWMTASPNFSAFRRHTLSLGLALVEVHVRAGELLRVAEEFADQQEIVTVDIVTGDRDLMLLVSAGGQRELSSFILGNLEPHPSVIKVRSHPVNSLHADASSWHLRSVARGDLVPAGTADGRTTLPKRELAEAIAAILGRDGRASAAQVANELDMSLPAARAALARTIGSDLIRFRVEVSRNRTRWPIHAWYFMRSSALRRQSTAIEISKLAETRVVLATMGNADLIALTWLHSLAEVQGLEESFEQADAEMSVQDRALVLRTCKSMGKLLDEDGRARGYVPFNAYFGTPP